MPKPWQRCSVPISESLAAIEAFARASHGVLLKRSQFIVSMYAFCMRKKKPTPLKDIKIIFNGRKFYSPFSILYHSHSVT